jgi:hypothetical protein
LRPSIHEVIGIAALALGCASYPKPVDNLASSEAALRTAQEEEAQQSPKAALHVQLAQEELGEARNLLKKEDNEKADLMLMKSTADAELAIALVRESKAETAAREEEEERGRTDLNGILIAPNAMQVPGGAKP